MCIEVNVGRGRDEVRSPPDLAKLAMLTSAVPEIFLVGKELTLVAPNGIARPRAMTRPASITEYRVGLALVLYEHGADVLPISSAVGPVWQWQHWPAPSHEARA